jgi:hypothetical protein
MLRKRILPIGRSSIPWRLRNLDQGPQESPRGSASAGAMRLCAGPQRRGQGLALEDQPSAPSRLYQRCAVSPGPDQGRQQARRSV